MVLCTALFPSPINGNGFAWASTSSLSQAQSDYESEPNDDMDQADTIRPGVPFIGSPDLAIDGEMTINYALNTELRDKVFPFNRLSGKDVNTLIFPNLASASTAYRMMLEMGIAESVGPIQMGLNKPVHFASVHAPVRDIVNIAVIAGLDAAVLERSGGSNDK